MMDDEAYAPKLCMASCDESDDVDEVAVAGGACCSSVEANHQTRSAPQAPEASPPVSSSHGYVASNEAYAPKLCMASCMEDDDEEVVLESYQVNSSPSHISRQAVREGGYLDSLSACEVANMLRGMPPMEAARLALSMEDEERHVALAQMSDKERNAIVGAMPFDMAVAAGLVNPDVDDEEMVECFDDVDEDGDLRHRSRSGSWISGGSASSTGYSNSNSIRDKASDAAASVRSGLTQAAGRARSSAQAEKAIGAASTAADMAKTSLLQAKEKAMVSAENAKVSERAEKAKVSAIGAKEQAMVSAMGAMGVAKEQARRAREAAAAATPTSGEAKERAGAAKEKAIEKAAVAAQSASAALSSASKGLSSMWMNRNSKRSNAKEEQGELI